MPAQSPITSFSKIYRVKDKDNPLLVSERLSFPRFFPHVPHAPESVINPGTFGMRLPINTIVIRIIVFPLRYVSGQIRKHASFDKANIKSVRDKLHVVPIRIEVVNHG
jgi:hypothetical protein